VRHGDEVVVEEAHHERGAHARAFGIVLRGGEDRAVGALDLLADQALGERLRVLAREPLHRARIPRLHQALGDEGRRHAARHLSGVVAAHAIREDVQADLGARLDAILVMVAHAPRIGEARRLQRLRQAHRRPRTGLAPAAPRPPSLLPCAFCPMPCPFLSFALPRAARARRALGRDRPKARKNTDL